jgi:hypothetical protein
MDSGSSASERSQSSDEEEEVDDAPPDEAERSSSEEDLNECDIDDLVEARIEPCMERKYTAKTGIVWESTPRYAQRSLPSAALRQERISAEMKLTSSRLEINYFSLFFTNGMIDK